MSKISESEVITKCAVSMGATQIGWEDMYPKLDILCKELDEIFHDMNTTSCVECGGGCCRSCGSSEGYYGSENYPRPLYIKQKYGFTKKNGFASDKGCKLPRVLRSWTCNRFFCDRYKHELPAHRIFKISYEIAEIKRNLGMKFT